MAYPSFSGRTEVAIGGLEDALSTATSGNVLVLAPGTHTLGGGVNVPAGVTLRGASCTQSTTIECLDLVVGAFATFRDLTFTLPFDEYGGQMFFLQNDCWFENVIFHQDEVQGYVSSTGPAAGKEVTFKRCTFTITTEGSSWFYIYDDMIGLMTFESCLFKLETSDVGIVVNDFSVDTTGLIHTYRNCTAINTGVGAITALDTYNGGVVNFFNCVSYEPKQAGGFFGDAGGHDNGLGCFVQHAAPEIGALPYYYLTEVKQMDLHPDSWAPRNGSPARQGGDLNEVPRLDKNYIPYDPEKPSAGCYQWYGEFAALYRPWFLDPLDGFNFVYDGEDTDGLLSGVTQVNSNHEMACIIRKVIHDLTHPSRADVFTTHDGGYQIVETSGALLFDLYITGPAAKVFGTQSMTNRFWTE